MYKNWTSSAARLAAAGTMAIILVGCKSPTTVGEVIFADASLSSCVSSTYPVTLPLTDVVELNCQVSPITSLAGVEWLSNLKILRLQGPNTISDLKPLEKLPSFSVLSLYGLSEELVDVTPLLNSNSFTELYIENGPSVDCSGIDQLALKLGENYVILANGICSD